ncbi:RNI-like protein [Rhizoclosmatium globosum]|uniref:RNI-like protein n=1 Tax=Rhizoclosmatium globosum TaxID=329046 RepID=A0A1Y2CYH2_9FUNG|nr:RNI-like protein [Rhizoclosmatium globosum]|eukprot:ORY52079.1 RNI-like protein [Rhizoclosmatium globosum]
MASNDVFTQLVAMGFNPQIASQVSELQCGSVDEAVGVASALADEAAADTSRATLRLGSGTDVIRQQAELMNSFGEQSVAGAVGPSAPGEGAAAHAPPPPPPPPLPTEEDKQPPTLTSRYTNSRADYINIAALETQRKLKQLIKDALRRQIKDDRDAKKSRLAGFAVASSASTSTSPPTPTSTAAPVSHNTSLASLQFRLPSSILKTPSTPPLLKHAFNASDKLSVVFLFLRHACSASIVVPPASHSTLQLHSSYPRAVFEESNTATNTATTIKEAGLFPSASLNLVLVPLNNIPEPFVDTNAAPLPATIENIQNDDEMDEGEDGNENPMSEDGEGEDINDDDDNNDEDNDNEGIHDGNDGNENESDDGDDGDDDEFDGDGDHVMGMGPGRVLGGVALPADPTGPANLVPLPRVEPGGRGRGFPAPGRGLGRGGLFGAGRGGLGGGFMGGGGVLGGGGAGNRLGGAPPQEPAPGEENQGADVIPNQNQALDARALRLAAIENRTVHAAIAAETESTDAVHHSYSSRKLRSPLRLLELAMHAAVSLLSQHGNKKVLKHHQQYALRRLGADLGEMIIQSSTKTRKLDRAFLTRLASCPVTSYNLDSYGLTTDSLLETIGFTHYLTLQNLSLKGCTFLTDEGIFALQTCHNLVHLDLNSCRVTDTIFNYLVSFQNLSFLSLARTKITSKGLKKFASSPNSPPVLETLILSGCPGITSATTLQDLIPFLSRSLHTLSLQNCPLAAPLIMSLSPTETRGALSHLSILDVSHIPSLVDQDLTLFSTFPSLLDLDLSGSGVSGVFGKAEDASDVVERPGFFSGFGESPATGLSKGSRDLIVRSNHLEGIKLPHKGDAGVNIVVRALSGIGGGSNEAMKLVKLDLDGFKYLTDYGIQGIGRFSSTLKVLCLSGTHVTDAGVCEAVRLLKGLGELNLDRTVVGDAVSEAIQELMLLETLSLCETGMTDVGVIKFKTARFRFTLKRLNLARTEVSETGISKGLFAFEKLVSLNVERSGVTAVENLLNMWDLEARKGGNQLSLSIRNGNGIRWAGHVPDAPPVFFDD